MAKAPASKPATKPATKRKPRDPLAPPRGLDPAARREWNRVLKAIRAEREPNALHLSALTRYVRAWSLYETAAAAIPNATVAEVEVISQSLARCDRLLRNASADLGIRPPDFRPEMYGRPAFQDASSDLAKATSWP